MQANIRYCSATSKRTQKPCRARAMRGMQVCYHHGGRSLRGESHPNFKHGFYSTAPFVSVLWALIGYRYRQVQANERVEALLMANADSLETTKDWQRLMQAVRIALAQPYRPIPRAWAAELWQTRHETLLDL